MGKIKRTNWYKDAIVYQIYPRSFCDSNGDGLGDIRGIISKIDYLASLGVNCVWLSPIYESPQQDNGYDISNYYDIYPPFGTLEDAKEMFAKFKEKGIRVIMDLVVNHTSDQHYWFKDVNTNPNSPYKDFYIIRKKVNGKLPNKWKGFFHEDVWTKLDCSEDEYYFHMFAKTQPELNWENPKLREEVKKILRFWLDLGVSGFRCDVINLISKDYSKFGYGNLKLFLKGYSPVVDGPRLNEYLHELYEDVLSHYDCMTVGETVFGKLDTSNQLVDPKNEELDMVFNMDHLNVDAFIGAKWFYRKFKLKRLMKVVNKWQKGLVSGNNSLFIENHDQRRSVGRFGTNDKEYRVQSAKMLAVSYFLLKGTPFIYQGQEIGMTNTDINRLEDLKDIEALNFYPRIDDFPFLKKYMRRHFFEVVRDNARTPMQWDDSKYAGFSTSEPWLKVNANKDKINVKESLNDPNGIIATYKFLIDFRKNSDVIKHGSFDFIVKNNNSIFAYIRKKNNKEVVVISNFTAKEKCIKKLEKYLNYELCYCNYEKDLGPKLRPYETRTYIKN